MSKYEIITYSRSTGDIAHSKRLYSTRWNAEAALRTAGYAKNHRLPGIWYSEKYYSKVKRVIP
jgi:hypothetical protein|uniref:Uncharacterized protein n=1 Tax=Siphoviridae sp. ctckI12 TaxID=2825574 RepID=A0A8S5NZZ2_9CAUD|nr:MAG TPA: hypothetical protein [Siphoviridae sp. ctckI12]